MNLIKITRVKVTQETIEITTKQFFRTSVYIFHYKKCRKHKIDPFIKELKQKFQITEQGNIQNKQDTLILKIDHTRTIERIKNVFLSTEGSKRIINKNKQILHTIINSRKWENLGNDVGIEIQ